MKIICDWKDCMEPGLYKAPIEKDNSKKYRMLCLKHVREFNKNWNYFEGMNDGQIYDFLKSDMTWHKPLLSDLSNVIQRSKEVGIEKLLTISTSFESFSRVKELINKDEMIYGTIGIHPHLQTIFYFHSLFLI